MMGTAQAHTWAWSREATCAVAATSAVTNMRCLVLDDHQLVAQAVGGLLGELCCLEQVRICNTVAEAVTRIDHDCPDLLVLDVELPGERWQDAVASLHRGNPEAKVVFLTALGQQFVPPAEIQPLVLAVVDKATALNDLIALVNDWQQRNPPSHPNGGAPTELALNLLTPREIRVFRALGKGLLNKQIAQELGLSLSTVETYRKSISSKLGLSGAELVRAAVLQRISGTSCSD